jgi:hypothetical protein
MSKIQLPPKKNAEIQMDDKPVSKVNEKKIQYIINKGGSPVKTDEPLIDTVKNFNIMVLESDLHIIGELCNKRPKKPGRVIGFSKKDWLLEAVQEKIERERRKYNI